MKPTKRTLKRFVKEEAEAAKGYHKYDADRSIRAIEKDEKTHRKVFLKKLRKIKKVS